MHRIYDSSKSHGFLSIYKKIPGRQNPYCGLFYAIIITFRSSPPRGVLRRRCSKNMQQIYRRTPMPECDFNKAANQLYLNHTLAWVFSCKFAAIFRTSFTKNTSGWLLLKYSFFFLSFLKKGILNHEMT